MKYHFVLIVFMCVATLVFGDAYDDALSLAGDSRLIVLFKDTCFTIGSPVSIVRNAKTERSSDETARARNFLWNGLEIQTRLSDDLIYFIDIVSDEYTTASGVQVGDSFDAVLEKNGYPISMHQNDLLHYSFPIGTEDQSCYMIIKFENDTVQEIMIGMEV